MLNPEQMKLKVLVIDDVPSARRVVRRLLEKIGFADVEECANGKIAFERLQSGEFGIIISDWNMPDMSGLELVQKVRDTESLSKIPFLMITSTAQKEEVVTAVKSGVSEFVVNPFSLETLTLKLEHILKIS